MKWSVTEKFHDYLYGNSFLVFTGNNPLSYVLTTAKLDSTEHRWLAGLQLYNFSIRYRPGRTNIDAELLSRLPRRVTEETKLREERPKTDAGADTLEYQEISQEAIGAICQAVRVDAWFDSLCFSSQLIDEQEFDVIDNVKLWDVREAQRQDPVIGRLLPFVMNGKLPKPGQLPKGREFQQFLKEFRCLSL